MWVPELARRPRLHEGEVANQQRVGKRHATANPHSVQSLSAAASAKALPCHLPLTSLLASFKHVKLVHAATAAVNCSAVSRCSGVYVSRTLSEVVSSTNGIDWSLLKVRHPISCCCSGVSCASIGGGSRRAYRPRPNDAMSLRQQARADNVSAIMCGGISMKNSPKVDDQ